MLRLPTTFVSGLPFQRFFPIFPALLSSPSASFSAVPSSSIAMSNKPVFRKGQVEGKGHGLLANANIASGSVILSVPNPYVAILQNDALDAYCYECFLSSPRIQLERCGGCQSVRYCSKPCQSKSWKRDHKFDCQIYKELKAQGDRILPTQMRALVSILARLRQEKEKGTGVAASQIAELESHQERLLQDTSSATSKTLRLVAQLLKPDLAEQGLAQRIYCILQINAFQLTDHTENEIGLLFDPLLSLANHSCIPNAFVSVDGRKASLRALHPIAEGEEICISYIETTDPLEVRGAVLKDKYLFSCSCARCRDDKTVYQVYRDLLPLLSGSVSKALPDVALNSLYRPLPPDQLTRFCEAAPYSEATSSSLSELTRTRELPVAGYPLADRTQELYIRCLTESRFGFATILLIAKICNLDPIRYPSPHHPNRVASYLALGRLLPSALDQTDPLSLCAIAAKLGHRPEFADAREVIKLLEEKDLEVQLSVLLLARRQGLVAFGDGSRFVDEVDMEIGGVVGEMKRRHESGKPLSDYAVKFLESGLEGEGLTKAKALWELVARLADTDKLSQLMTLLEV